MSDSKVRFTTFSRTKVPPQFVRSVVDVFRANEETIGTKGVPAGLRSYKVLAALREDLESLGFEVERRKRRKDKIQRPVFFGENGAPTVRYEIDAYHPEWDCGLEVEAGRGWKGNAVYRDLILASVMVNVGSEACEFANVVRARTRVTLY